MEGLIFGILQYLKKKLHLTTPLQNSEEFVKNQALSRAVRCFEIGQNLRNDVLVDMCSILADIGNYHLNSWN